MNCTNPKLHEDDRLCFCPEEGSGYSVRQVLAQKFTNWWVTKGWALYANKLASDGSMTEGDLWDLLWQIEDAANDAYGMWRQML